MKGKQQKNLIYLLGLDAKFSRHVMKKGRGSSNHTTFVGGTTFVLGSALAPYFSEKFKIIKM